MKTRYTPLVSVKKNIMQKSEQVLQQANASLLNAKEALKLSLEALNGVETPSSGALSAFLSARALLDSQRKIIVEQEAWIAFAEQEVSKAQEQLKLDMIEYEKFKYLELQEIKKIEQKQKMEEAKNLDEIALMTYDTTKRRVS